MRRKTTLLVILGTPINASIAVVGNVVVLWMVLAWLGRYWHSGRTWGESLLIGFASMLMILIADFGHAIAHIFSARYAGAPMDEIVISTGMPRTLYQNNEVAPSIHRLRAIGGPIFNLVCLLLSLLVYAVTSSGSLGRELAGWSAIGHGFILMGSLMPLPIVDGGTILKWTLVERDHTPAQAEEVVSRVNMVIGVLGLIGGAIMLTLPLWYWGLVLIGAGVVSILAAMGKIR